MAGYSDTRQLIIDTLMGRPAGTEIQPEDHQAFALQITDYVRAVELVAGNATPIGFADASTVPVQPDNGQAVYLSQVNRGTTVTFANFIDQNGNAISVTSDSSSVTFVTLLWNGQYWSSQTTVVSASVLTAETFRVTFTQSGSTITSSDSASAIQTAYNAGKYVYAVLGNNAFRLVKILSGPTVVFEDDKNKYSVVESDVTKESSELQGGLSIPWCYTVFGGINDSTSEFIKFTWDGHAQGTVSVEIPFATNRMGIAYRNSDNGKMSVYQTNTPFSASASNSFFYVLWFDADNLSVKFDTESNFNSSQSVRCFILALFDTTVGSEYPVTSKSLYSVNGVLFTPLRHDTITTLQGNITTLQGNITTLQGNISDINKKLSIPWTTTIYHDSSHLLKFTINGTGLAAQVSVDIPFSTGSIGIVYKNSSGEITAKQYDSAYSSSVLTGSFFYVLWFDADNLSVKFTNVSEFNTAIETLKQYYILATVQTTYSDYMVTCPSAMYSVNGVLFTPLRHDTITTLQGNITTLQGNITTLQGNITTLQGNILEIKSDIYTQVTDVEVSISEQNVLGFYDTSGQIITTFSDWKHDIFDLSKYSEITSLKASTSFSTGGGPVIFAFLGESKNFLGYYLTVSNPPVSYEDEELVSHIPSGTKYLAVCKHPQSIVTSVKITALFKQSIEEINNKIIDLTERVEAIEGDTFSSDNRPKITFLVNQSQFVIRSEFDSTRDLVISYEMDDNGYYRPTSTRIGLKTDSLTTILSSSIAHNMNDSIAPIQTAAYWFIGGQHGYLIPVVISSSHDKTEEDIGSWWVDSNGKQFQLGSISGTSLRFLPKITVDSETGLGTSDYYFGYTMTNLTHVSGATHTSAITVDTSSSMQVKPCTKNVINKFYLGNKEITSNDYNKELTCKEVSYITSADIINPAGATVFPTMDGNVWFNVTQSYNFIGLSCSVKQTFKLFTPMALVYYGATQPLGLTSFGDFHSYMFVPKVKSQTSGEITTDWKYPQDVTTPNQTWAKTYFTLNADDIENLDNLPERVIEYYKNPTTQEYSIGFASGLSLVSSATKQSVRSNNVGVNGILFHIANDGRNKLYFRVITPNGSLGTNLPANMTFNYNYYQCYYNPNSNALVYWYKDGDSYIIYIHSFNENASCSISLPNFLENKNLTVIEKTDNITLLTDSVINREIFIKQTGNLAEYLVLKTN